MTFAGRLDWFCDRINRAVEGAIGLLAAMMIVVIFAQVIFRYVLDSSLTWSEELARYTFIWVIFLGTSCAMRRGQHMAVEGIFETIPTRWVSAFKIIVGVTNAALFSIVIYTGLILTHNAATQVSTALEIPILFVYVAAPIGGALTLLHIANGIVQILFGARSVATTV